TGSVSLPKAAGAVPDNRIQLESRVQRVERLAQCEKLVPLDALKPVARKVLKSLPRGGRGEIRAARDRSRIKDTINLLPIPVADGGRGPARGWGGGPQPGASGLGETQQVLKGFRV